MAESTHAEIAQNKPSGRQGDGRAETVTSPLTEEREHAACLPPTPPAAARQTRLAPHTMTPASILALQRSVGNQAVQRVLANRRRQAIKPAPSAPPVIPAAAPLTGAPMIQRKTYLADADKNIYKDTKHTDIDLAFIGVAEAKAGKKRPIYIPYQICIELHTKVQQQWSEVEANGLTRFYPQRDVFAKQVIAGDVARVAGMVYWENEAGDLEKYPLTGPALIYKLSLAGASGPMYWNTGGGSRLPHAEGTVYMNEIDEAEALDRLGIGEDDRKARYSGVTFVQLENMEYIRTILTLQENGANVIDLGSGIFYVSNVQVMRSKHSQFMAMGKYYNHDFSDVSSAEELNALRRSFESLDKPEGQDWKMDLTSRDRGDGQAKAMQNWNALGAAAFANRYYGKNFPLNQNWEWLHIRGAQIGGATTGKNLAAGLYVTNSEMIPYENQIAAWAQKGGGRLFARFGVGGTWFAFTDQIVIEVYALNHPELGTIPREAPLRVEFNPLTGQVVDKLKGQIQQLHFAHQIQQRQESADEDDVEIILNV